MTGTAHRVVVIGDSLLDRDVHGSADRLSPDGPVPVVDVADERSRPGGAGLAAMLAAADGREVTLVTALGRDQAGEELASLLSTAGVNVVDIGTDGSTAEKVRVMVSGRSLVRLDRGCPTLPPSPWPARATAALRGAAAVLVSDYGRGVSTLDGCRAALADLPRRTPVVWDPHPKGADPVPGARLVTPNEKEASLFAPDVEGDSLAATTARARMLAGKWDAAGVAVTLGSRGALFWGGDGPPLAVPAQPASGDTCGAGDRFASAAAGCLAEGALPTEAVSDAVRTASEFVQGNREERPTGAPGTARDVAARVRAGGGTVVVAGGCFDLLHAGHVRMLQAARALGDCLIVCLNSDASVRRLKGSGRPLVSERDRAAVLTGLACVDAVDIFAEDTPEAALRRVRPDVFVKGADYSAGDLPESSLLATWGGQVVVVPFLDGHSTSALVDRMGAFAR
jgi:D-beta-D-heptose 7-phosphate kinase/D-beta-D-heptose 1-phosphate adenosyltransferase